MRIYTNTSSLLAQSNLNKSQNKLGSAIERLSSGLRINGAKDDAAGLAISNRMESVIRGGQQANKNTQDAISLLSTLDGGLDEINNIVQRLRELSIQQKNDTLSTLDKTYIQHEIDAQIKEIDRIGRSMRFNDISLFNDPRSLSFQVGEGDNSNGTDTLSFSLREINSKALGLAVSKPNISAAKGVGNPLVLTAPQWKVDGSFEKFEVNLAIKPGVMIQGTKAVAEYLGISEDENSLHDLFDIDGNDVLTKNPAYLDGIAVKIGNDYYWKPRSASDYKVSPDGTLSMDVYLGGTVHKGTAINYETGETENIPLDHSQLGVDVDGNTVAYYEYNGWQNYRIGPTSQVEFYYDKYGNNVSPHKATLGNNALLEGADAAIDILGRYRAVIGATINRLESIENGLNNDSIALKAAQSRIQDADYAAEISNMTRSQILQQAGQAVLAQANQVPQGILSLLRS